MANRTEDGDISLNPLVIVIAGTIFIAVTIGTIQNGGIGYLAEPGGIVLAGLSLLSLAGIAFIGLQFKVEIAENGVNDAIDWFFNHEFGGSSNDSSQDSETIDKVPPPTEKKKNRLKFERANRQCEFCENQSDHLEIHHIKPRAKGGSNKLRNLIALCPECHRKADRGAYSRSELKYHVRRSMDRWEGQQ